MGVFPEVFFAPVTKTFEFWEGVLDEVAELFPGEIIHIGEMNVREMLGKV